MPPSTGFAVTRPTALRVLLVEDNLLNQKLLASLLKHLINCAVTFASDGRQAVDKSAKEDFDVVFMDVQMPVMDGLDATRLIRRQEAGTSRHTPIIAVTAGVDRRICLAAGMDDYLAKPVREKMLQQKLEHNLGRQF